MKFKNIKLSLAASTFAISTLLIGGTNVGATTIKFIEPPTIIAKPGPIERIVVKEGILRPVNDRVKPFSASDDKVKIQIVQHYILETKTGNYEVITTSGSYKSLVGKRVIVKGVFHNTGTKKVIIAKEIRKAEPKIRY